MDSLHTVSGISLDWHWTDQHWTILYSRTGIGLALDTLDTEEGMITAAGDWPAIFIQRTPKEKFIK